MDLLDGLRGGTGDEGGPMHGVGRGLGYLPMILCGRGLGFGRVVWVVPSSDVLRGLFRVL
jgi:hypothetical protein